MTIKLFDPVEVIKDIPDKRLKTGMRGAVVEIYTKPTLGYEVEFDNIPVNDLNIAALLPDQIKKVE